MFSFGPNELKAVDNNFLSPTFAQTSKNPKVPPLNLKKISKQRSTSKKFNLDEDGLDSFTQILRSKELCQYFALYTLLASGEELEREVQSISDQDIEELIRCAPDSCCSIKSKHLCKKI